MVIHENVIVDDQKEILKQTKQFYEKLYKRQDCLKKVNLSTEIRYNDIPKLTENQKQSLEGEISLPELTSALNRMKNNKSPGSDGFTVDFFKFFWIDLGKFVLRSVNYGYQQRKNVCHTATGSDHLYPKRR